MQIRELLVGVTTGARTVRVEARWVRTIARATAFHLIVDLCRDRVIAGDRELVMEAREIPLRMLATLARASGGTVGCDALFQQAWGLSYVAERHANALHAHISVLRTHLNELLGRNVLERTGNGYRLDPALRCAVLEPLPVRPGSRASKHALLAHARLRGFLDRRSVGRLAGLHRTRAHALLVTMVRDGWLVRDGGGRGTRYRVNPLRCA
jgi:DNA-binding winged helix-turn-helix (wHTH) protein